MVCIFFLHSQGVTAALYMVCFKMWFAGSCTSVQLLFTYFLMKGMSVSIVGGIILLFLSDSHRGWPTDTCGWSFLGINMIANMSFNLSLAWGMLLVSPLACRLFVLLGLPVSLLLDSLLGVSVNAWRVLGVATVAAGVAGFECVAPAESGEEEQEPEELSTICEETSSCQVRANRLKMKKPLWKKTCLWFLHFVTRTMKWSTVKHNQFDFVRRPEGVIWVDLSPSVFIPWVYEFHLQVWEDLLTSLHADGHCSVRGWLRGLQYSTERTVEAAEESHHFTWQGFKDMERMRWISFTIWVHLQNLCRDLCKVRKINVFCVCCHIDRFLTKEEVNWHGAWLLNFFWVWIGSWIGMTYTTKPWCLFGTIRPFEQPNYAGQEDESRGTWKWEHVDCQLYRWASWKEQPISPDIPSSLEFPGFWIVALQNPLCLMSIDLHRKNRPVFQTKVILGFPCKRLEQAAPIPSHFHVT